MTTTNTTPFEVWVIDPNGDDQMFADSYYLDDLIEDWTAYAIDALQSGCRVEIWRDGNHVTNL